MIRKKIAIIGAGYVGATTAFALATSGLASEVVLVDINKEKAEGEAMDIKHGASFLKPVIMRAGDYSDCAEAQIIVFTAGANQKPGETRLDLVHRNVDILKSSLPELLKYCPDSLYLMVTNPVDIMTYVAWKISGLPQNQVIGSGTVLDSSRFRNAISEFWEIDPRNVHAYIIGEHGDTAVPVWSLANVAGVNLEDYCKVSDAKCFTDEARADILQKVRGAAYEIIKRKGATYYAIAVATKKICESILRDENSILTISGPLNGEYGLTDVALSLPSLVSNLGREKLITIPLSAEEQKSLHHSAKTLQEIIQSLKI